MCGLLAILSPAIPISIDLLTMMRDRMVHRGPDSGDIWLEHNARVALAHRRLSIVDKSSGSDQPMVSPDGRWRIVFNGEIYNYHELRSELQGLGVEFHTRGDTEVLLSALRMWGEGALLRFNGMFAFALWDARDRRLLVARDRFGEKPIFIGRGKFGAVAIASEMKAILAHPLISSDISHQALERYGAGAWYEDDQHTFFESIERVPPAHAMWLSADGQVEKRWRYWQPDYEDVDTSIKPREAVERFTELLQQSIRLRLRADVPVGSSLSGGLDSSVTVGLLAQYRNRGMFTQNTFSACFPDDLTISEHHEIDRVAKHTGVNSFRVTPEAQHLAEESALLHWHQEEPVLSASIYVQWCVARLARQHDTTVLLDGQGADELLAGYQFYFKQRQLDLLDRGELALAMRETKKFTGRLKYASKAFDSPERRFNPLVAYSCEELRELNSNRPGVFHYPYTEGVAPARPGGRLRRTLSEAMLYNSLPMLLRYADRNYMAFSRETRLPYLDHDLVDFCLRLPDDYLVRNGWQKWILREAAGSSIPSLIRWRADKVGFAAPLDTWLRGDLKEWGYARVFDDALKGLPGYDAEALSVLWRQHQGGSANNSWALWRWISLSEWLSVHRAGWWRSGTTRGLVM